MLGDSVYVGGKKLLMTVSVTKRKFQRTNDERLYNQVISCDRVKCENFYGRMLNLFGVMRMTYRYDHHQYDNLFKMCAALTNWHMLKMPLKELDTTKVK